MNGNPYVTYIEYRYLEKCKRYGNGAEVVADWKSKKNYYRRMTQTTIYEFMNYSMHDESHSINILESIEMILGRERINKMSRSDLWLLINVAYAHDIGMALEYPKLEQLWSKPEFQKYIEEAKDSIDRDDARGARFYKLLDGLLKNHFSKVDKKLEKELKFEIPIHDSWPLEFRRAVTLLMSNYIRKNHGMLSEEFFAVPEGKNDHIICDRMRRLIGRISACHMEGQESIDELPCYCKGFGTDSMHPRFIATLLRLGDLLDLDNNRFDVFSIRHFGPLPDISVANYKKHKSITHFHISPDMIEVTAKSDDFQVCKLHYQWFEYMKKDIEYLITHWNKIAPKQLRGCLLGVPKLEIWHGTNRFKNGANREFILQKEKLLDLFMGHNLYKSKLEFIREYIQNAFDASKIQLFYEIRSEYQSEKDDYTFTKRDLYLNDENIDLKNLKPFDLTRMAFEAFPIVVRLKYDREDKESFILQIIDKGIGIDEEGIAAITNVGIGWKKRENHRKALSEMREWMKPTGGFGIGLQSAFLVTDEIIIHTKSAFEPAFRITLSKYSGKNNVLVEVDESNINQGTKVEFRIKFNTFDEPVINELCSLSEKDYFTQKGRMEIIYDILQNYLMKMFPSALFPIKIIKEAENRLDNVQKKVLISSKVYQEQDEKYFVPKYCKYGQDYKKLSNYEYYDSFFDFIKEFYKSVEHVYVNFENGILRVWDDVSQVFYYFSLSKDQERVNVLANYRNVLVENSTRVVKLENTKHAEFLEICYDVMGVPVEKCLKVSRDSFLETANVKQIILTEQFVKAYSRLLLKHFSKSAMSAKVLAYAVLIEKDEALINGTLENCGNVLAMEQADVWTLDRTEDGKLQRHTENLSLQDLLKSQEDYLYFIVKGEHNSENDKASYYATVTMHDRKWVLKDSDTNTVGEYEAGEIKVIYDKKISAVICQYRMDKEKSWIRIKEPLQDGYIDILPLNIGEKGKELSERLSSWKSEEKQIGRKIEPERFNRPFNIMDSDDERSCLLVKKRPFEQEDEETYIISPYTEEVGMLLNNSKITSKEEKIKIIEKHLESDEAYKEICQWVYEHQIEERCSLSDIDSLYRKMIQDYIELS